MKILPVTDSKFQPFALAIGQFGLAWNDLHELLGRLFAKSIGTDEPNVQGLLIWGVITSDRQKRQILEAAIGSVGGKVHRNFPQLAADVTWVLKKATSLEDKRNNVIHAPFEEVSSPLVAALIKQPLGSVSPSGLNNRGWSLAKSTVHIGKDVVNEINLYRDYAQKLAQFSIDLLIAWQKPDDAWPKRPALPQLKG